MVARLKMNQTYCPICGEVILIKDKFCDECKEDARKRLKKVFEFYYDNFKVREDYSGALIELVAKEIKEEKEKELNEEFERWRSAVKKGMEI